VSAECVWRLEDLLDRSAEPYDPLDPLVCCEASPDPLVSEGRQPRPVAPGQPVRYDDDYRREGICHLCMCFEPRPGWRQVKVTDRRTTQDVAHWMSDRVAIHVPKAAVISVVLAHLNTHIPAAWYAPFPPAEACRIWRKLDVHDTPKHGSWLKMAEIGCAMVVTQGVDRRLGNQETIRREIAAWEARRNAAKATVDWRFPTTKARRILKHIYPL
jgi:hypothetical protein